MNSTETTSSEGIANPPSESLHENKNTEETLDTEALKPMESLECGFEGEPLNNRSASLNSASKPEMEVPFQWDGSNIQNPCTTVEHSRLDVSQRLGNNRARIVVNKDYNLFLSKSPQKLKRKHGDRNLHRTSNFAISTGEQGVDDFASVTSQTTSVAGSGHTFLPTNMEGVPDEKEMRREKLRQALLLRKAAKASNVLQCSSHEMPEREADYIFDVHVPQTYLQPMSSTRQTRPHLEQSVLESVHMNQEGENLSFKNGNCPAYTYFLRGESKNFVWSKYLHRMNLDKHFRINIVEPDYVRFKS